MHLVALKEEQIHMMNKSTISESSNEDEMEYTNEEFKFDQEANKELPDDTF
jgi:hypothetical protein